MSYLVNINIEGNIPIINERGPVFGYPIAEGALRLLAIRVGRDKIEFTTPEKAREKREAYINSKKPKTETKEIKVKEVLTEPEVKIEPEKIVLTEPMVFEDKVVIDEKIDIETIEVPEKEEVVIEEAQHIYTDEELNNFTWSQLVKISLEIGAYTNKSSASGSSKVRLIYKIKKFQGTLEK